MNISIRKPLLFAALIIICCSNALQAQDIIMLRTGDEIQAKVLEIGDRVIRYTEFGNQDSTTYDIQKSDVFLIKYEDGAKDVFLTNSTEGLYVSSKPPLTYDNGVWQDGTKIRPAQVREMMSENDEALQEYKHGRGAFVVGQIIAYPCAFLLGWDLGARLLGWDLGARYGKGNDVCLVIGLAGTAVGIIMALTGESQMRKSVSLYNASLMHGTTTYSLNFGITGSGGVGFTLNF